MPKLHTIFYLVGVLSLSGCSSWSWPIQGSGGFAEHHQQTLYPILPSNKALETGHGLRFDLELSSRHLDVLVLEGAMLCLPATVVEAKQRQSRIIRQLQGGLEDDAANDIIIQREFLARLERRLDYLKQKGICVIPAMKVKSTTSPSSIPKQVQKKVQKKPSVTTDQVSNLLNSDNQFAIDSSELNPKYKQRLSKAVQFLKKIPQYTLLITGHTDDTGKNSRNQQLARDRAEQVGEYLKSLGLPINRLQLHAEAAKTPLFTGNEPQVRLVNRRVGIKLVIANNTMMR